MTPTYDQARQLGKAYVGALNTGIEAYSALFASGARVRVDGSPSDLHGVLEVTPPGRSGFRGARLDGDHVLYTVRVRDRAAESVEDRVHRIAYDDDGRVASLDA
ncbi:MAG: hypothetical protein AB7V42_12245 [Thermoleophilia bacterium]